MSGTLTSKLATEASKVSGLTGDRIGNYLQILFTIISGVLIAFTACWKLALVVLACIPIVAVGQLLQLKMIFGTSFGILL